MDKLTCVHNVIVFLLTVNDESGLQETERDMAVSTLTERETAAFLASMNTEREILAFDTEGRDEKLQFLIDHIDEKIVDTHVILLAIQELFYEFS